MNKPKVSVIMPAYNHEAFVGPAIASVLNQSFADFELVIVDDGSTDKTADVIHGFSDDRIKYHYQENRDAFNALNRGMELADGTWFSILNSDDIYHPGRLARCVETAEAGAEVVITGVSPINDEGASIPVGSHYWHIWHTKNRELFHQYGDLYSAFLRGNLMVTTSNLFMSARAARQVGGFAPLRYLHDYDYMFRLLLACPDKIAYLEDEELLQYRIHGSNTLKQGAITAREQDMDLIRKYMNQGTPEQVEERTAIGNERLRELEREMIAVKRGLKWGPIKPLVDKLIQMVRK